MYNYLDPPAAAPGELGTIEPQRIIITRTTVRNTVDIFSDIVSGLERVADHATNIAFAITTEEEMDEGKTN